MWTLSDLLVITNEQCQFDNANWDKSFEVPTTNAKPLDVES